MKKEHFLLIIMAMILVSAIFLRIFQLKIDDKKISPNIVSSNIISQNQNLVDMDKMGDLVEENINLENNIDTENNFEVLVFNPLPGTEISSPLEIVGQAPGTWFFEATLPVKLISPGGDIIASYYAEAQSDWMVETPVDFKTTLEFTTDFKSGYLIIAKDNPSGLPENDASFMIPVNFK